MSTRASLLSLTWYTMASFHQSEGQLGSFGEGDTTVCCDVASAFADAIARCFVAHRINPLRPPRPAAVGERLRRLAAAAAVAPAVMVVAVAMVECRYRVCDVSRGRALFCVRAWMDGIEDQKHIKSNGPFGIFLLSPSKASFFQAAAAAAFTTPHTRPCAPTKTFTMPQFFGIEIKKGEVRVSPLTRRRCPPTPPRAPPRIPLSRRSLSRFFRAAGCEEYANRACDNGRSQRSTAFSFVRFSTSLRLCHVSRRLFNSSSAADTGHEGWMPSSDPRLTK